MPKIHFKSMLKGQCIYGLADLVVTLSSKPQSCESLQRW